MIIHNTTWAAGLLALIVSGALSQPVNAQSADPSVITMPSGAAASAVRKHVLDLRAKAEGIDPEATRILGGRPSQEGAWPSQVSLHDPNKARESEDGMFQSQFCGGTFITNQWVLTAAHCVVDAETRPISASDVVVRSSSVDLYKGDLHNIARVIVHEQYEPVGFENDIALLQLQRPVQQSSGPVGAINVLRQGQSVPEGPAMVIGWGMMEEDKFPSVLMETDINIVPNATCNQGMIDQTRNELGGYLWSLGQQNDIPREKLEEAFAILANNMGEQLSQNMICAGIASGAQTSCNGDSGGPLMVRDQSGQWLQVGIVSWGREPANAETRCAHENLYSVYTNLGQYYNWIASYVQG